MPEHVIETVSMGKTPPTADLSMLDLFLHADVVVQLVMLILLGASFWCWTIIFAKIIKLRYLKAKADAFEESFWSGGSLENLFDRIGLRPKDPLSAVFVSAMQEWRRSSISRGQALSHELRATLQQRVERVMNTTLNREMESVERHMTFLASVGSTAPFVGLFGTVWGIMHSFQGIAASQSTNLAVVAPGIAEALFATALGLIAAIPAVLAYNKISTEISRYANRLETFSQEFATLISRQLEGAE
jgi:biopolymer transport protein TolQ